MSVLNIASIQLAPDDAPKAEILEKAAAAVRECRGADLVILPEIWNIGFMSFDRYREEAETPDGPTLTRMRELAVEMRVHLHTGSFVEQDEGAFYNSSYLLSPEGEILGRYRKIHLFGYRSREEEILTPGKSVTVADTRIGRFGLATCYDLRFPEFFRRMVDMGAEIFLVCSAWPYPRLEPWILFNRVRALENQCHLISANSAGFNQGVQYVGHSMVVDPWGTVLAGAGDSETVVRTAIDPTEAKCARERFPALADRRVWLNPTAR